MSSVFFDESLQHIFERDGIVSLPMLDEAEVDFFLSSSTGEYDIAKDVFHSTMFVHDVEYRKKTDQRIRSVMAPKVNKLLVDYRLLLGNFIIKQSSPDSGVGIHQDWNFTSPDFTSLNIWIPLVDIDDSTGVFYALKGSHKTFQNIRYTPYANNGYKKIEEYIMNHATPYRIKAGEAIIYNGAIVHFSQPNVSGSIRVAIGMALIPQEAPSLHYYKREINQRALEIYETDEAFYTRFDFFDEPRGVRKIDELLDYKELPSLRDLY